MKKLAPAIPVIAAAGILAALAVAGNSNVPTTISIDTNGSITQGTDTNLFIAGRVASSNPKCLPNRKLNVKGIYDTETTKRPFDTAVTSGRGGYNAIGPQKHAGHDITAAQLSVKPKDIGTKRHPKRCGGHKITIG